jgi:hypothetical protein
MNLSQNLSSVSHKLMVITTVAFGLIGLVLFCAPTWSAANFSWKISPMVAMTMGGWYLGTAVMAGLVVYYRRWNVIYSCMLYVSVFSLTETAVLLIHSAKLKLDALLAWPYIGMLGIAILTSLLVLMDWLRQKPRLTNEGKPLAAWVRNTMLAFIIFVFSLSGVAFSGHWIGLNGGIFPEPLSLFTLHSFGAFYFSLACSVIALQRVPRLSAVTVHVWGGLALISSITAAAFIYLPSFDFSKHPYQSIYLGVYLLALALSLIYLWNERAHRIDSVSE